MTGINACFRVRAMQQLTISGRRKGAGAAHASWVAGQQRSIDEHEPPTPGRRRAGLVPAVGVILAALLITGLVGCASTARTDFVTARDALDAGRPLDALIAATDALIEDPEFGRAKEFLRDNADTEIAAIESYLASTEGTQTPEDLDQRFDTFNKLVVFYDNLEAIGLPISKDEKLWGLIKGWEWSTPMVDYGPRVEPARAAAREGFLAAGYSAINAGELDTAHALMEKAVTKFAGPDSDEQAQDRLDIAAAFGEHADQYLGSHDADQLLHAIHAYEIGLAYNDQDESLVSGLAQAKIEVSDAFVALGLELEEAGTLESLTQAAGYFDRALEYNEANTEASVARDRVVVSIAEIHYQNGLELAEAYQDEESVDAALGAFATATEWVPEYRDCDVQVARLGVAKEIIVFSRSAAAAQEQFDETTAPVRALSELVTSAHNAMNQLNHVADKVVQLDGQLKTVNNTITLLTPVPYVGQALRAVGTPLSMVRRPLHATAESIDGVRDPVITPSRRALAETKEQVESIMSALNSVDRTLGTARDMSERLYVFVVEIDDLESLATIKRELGNLTGALDQLNDTLEEVNRAQAPAADSLAGVASYAELIDVVTSNIEYFMTPFDAVKGVTDAIESALNAEISVPLLGSFSVGGALDSANGLVADAAKAVVDPILAELNISIPNIPGLEELQQVFTAIEGYYEEILVAAEAIKDSAADVVEIPTEMQGCVAVIVEETGYR